MELSALLHLALLLFVIGANILLAIVVFLNNSKSATNRIFCLLSIVISIWILTNYLVLNPNIIGGTLLWSRLTIFWATPMSFLFFLLAYVLPKHNLTLSRKKFSTMIFLNIVVMFITLSPFAFMSAEIINGSVTPVAGPGMLPFSLITTFYSVAAVYILIKRTKVATGFEKEQFRYVMYGMMFMLGLIILTILVPAVIFQVTTFVPFIPLYTLIFLGMTNYAIIRHRLLDIRTFVARSLAYTLVVAIAGTAYTLATFLVTQYFFRSNITTNQALVYALLALFIALTFQPLKNSLQKMTERLFFKGKYNSNKLIQDLTTIMALTIRIDELTKKTLDQLVTTMRVSQGAFVIFIAESEDLVAKEGYEQEFIYDKEKVRVLCDARRLVIFEDESEGELKKLMREMNIRIALPLYEEGRKEGILLLGEKKSGEIYSQQDIEVLNIFGPEMLVAIQNAKSYQEISKFNVTLKQEVDKATKELRDANYRLTQLDKLKDEFVSVASHELRTPMTAIKSYLWMALEGRGGPISEKQKFYLQRAYNSVDRLIRLVSDMLNVSRIDSGRISLQLGIIDIQKVVQEVFDEVMPRIQELGVNLVMAPTQALPQVLADSDKVKEVLFNLIGNAMKFTPKGGTITVSFTQKEHMIETTVIDTGTGIDPANIDKLFQKFSMIADSYMANSSIQGTGLGLYISKSIVELHGGKIWATSEGHGKGTQFTFSLKVATEDEKKKIAEQPVDPQKPMIDIIHTGV